jgi:hypothetical protein
MDSSAHTTPIDSEVVNENSVIADSEINNKNCVAANSEIDNDGGVVSGFTLFLLLGVYELHLEITLGKLCSS